MSSLSFFLVRRTKHERVHTRVTEDVRHPCFSRLATSPLDALSRAWLTEEKKRLLAVYQYIGQHVLRLKDQPFPQDVLILLSA